MLELKSKNLAYIIAGLVIISTFYMTDVVAKDEFGLEEDASADYAPDVVPDVVFSSETREGIKLSEYRGKVVLLNFWASWCEPCIREMPALDKLQGELADKGFKVIALSEDGKFPDVNAFYQKYNIKNLEIFHDKGSKVFFDMGLKGLPYSIIIDREGRGATRIEGFIDWNSGTRLIIEGLLNK